MGAGERSPPADLNLGGPARKPGPSPPASLDGRAPLAATRSLSPRTSTNCTGAASSDDCSAMAKQKSARGRSSRSELVRSESRHKPLADARIRAATKASGAALDDPPGGAEARMLASPSRASAEWSRARCSGATVSARRPVSSLPQMDAVASVTVTDSTVAEVPSEDVEPLTPIGCPARGCGCLCRRRLRRGAALAGRGQLGRRGPAEGRQAQHRAQRHRRGHRISGIRRQRGVAPARRARTRRESGEVRGPRHVCQSGLDRAVLRVRRARKRGRADRRDARETARGPL